MDSATSAHLLQKYRAPIARIKDFAASLQGKYGGTRSPVDVATDLEDAICAELEFIATNTASLGYRHDVLREPVEKASGYTQPTSSVWPLIDLPDREHLQGLFRHQRDALAAGIAEAALLGGGWNGKTMISGPALLLLVKDMGDALKAQSVAAAESSLHVPVIAESESKDQGPTEAVRTASTVAHRVEHMITMYNGDMDPHRLRNERDAFVGFIADAALTAGLWDGKTKLCATDLLDLCVKMGKHIHRSTTDAASATPIGSALIEWATCSSDARGAVSAVLRDNGEYVYSSATRSAFLAADSMLAALASYRNPADAYLGYERLGAAWSSLPHEWTKFPLELKQSMIEGLFAWLNGIDKKARHPDTVRMCQVAEDLLCAAQHLGAGTTPYQMKPIVIGDALKRMATSIKAIEIGGDNITSILQSVAHELECLVAEERSVGFDYGDAAPAPTEYMEREFTCPKCASHFFRSEKDLVIKGYKRSCKGHKSYRCDFRWHEDYDHLYMKATDVPFAPPIYVNFRTALAIVGAADSGGRVADTIADATTGAPLTFRTKEGDAAAIVALDKRSIGEVLRGLCDTINTWTAEDLSTLGKVAKLKGKVAKWKKRAKKRT
jgi:hypothetical protein